MRLRAVGSDSLLFSSLPLRWKGFIEDLRSVEHLLRDRLLRERFQSVCIPSDMKNDIDSFKTWSISLKSLRWEQTVDFCSAVPGLQYAYHIIFNFWIWNDTFLLLLCVVPVCLCWMIRIVVFVCFVTCLTMMVIRLMISDWQRWCLCFGLLSCFYSDAFTGATSPQILEQTSIFGRWPT